MFKLLNTCPNVDWGSLRKRDTTANDALLGDNLNRGAQDSVRAAQPPTLVNISWTLVSEDQLEIGVDMESQSPVVAEYCIASSENPSQGQYVPFGDQLQATVTQDTSGNPFSFKLIYYLYVRLTNKEGLVRNGISGSILFPPPASLKLEHELRLPPDSPGFDLFQPPSYLPIRVGAPFAFYLYAQVLGGDFTDFESLGSLVTNAQVAVDETTNVFADQTAYGGTRLVWQRDPYYSAISSPRFQSANGNTYVVSFQNEILVC